GSMFYKQVVAIIAEGSFIFTHRNGAFEQREGLPGYDKSIGLGSAYIRAAVAYQAMGIRSHKLNAFLIQLKEYAGHGRTQVIVAGGKKRFVDGGNQGGSADSERAGIVGSRLFRKIVRIFTHHLILTIVAGNF